MKPSTITISRQFGSGAGRLELNSELAKNLNIPFYEKTLFEEASKRSGIHSDFFESAEARKNWNFANIFQVGTGHLCLWMTRYFWLK